MTRNGMGRNKRNKRNEKEIRGILWKDMEWGGVEWNGMEK